MKEDITEPTNQKVIGAVPRYIIDLDESPSDRWNQIIHDYKDQWLTIQRLLKNELKDTLGKFIGGLVENLVSFVMSAANSFGAVYYSRELKAMASKSGMKLGRLVALQLVYEIFSCCTSIVVPGEDGVPIHIRTMDWAMEFLEPLTVELDFRKNGKTLYMGTSWAGYVGILTGMRPDAYSVSINFRVTEDGTIWKNLKNAMSSCWPIGFLVRDVFETTSSYNQAVSYLANSSLIAPCYITICGTLPGQGTLITRDRKTELDRWTLEEKGFIVQTNIDHWSEEAHMDVMDSIERRRIVRDQLEKLESPDKSKLWTIVSNDPVFNSITVYGTYMNPSKGYLETRIPSKHFGFIPCKVKQNNRKDHLIYVTEDEIEDPTNRYKEKIDNDIIIEE